MSSDGRTMHSLLSGWTAASMSTLTLQPLDVIKTQMQKSVEKNSTITRTIRRLYRNKGISSFWSGSLPTLLRNGPGAAIYFASLHALSHNVHRSAVSMQSDGRTALVGATARSVACICTLPATVLKARLEASPRHHGLFNECLYMYRLGGVRSFYVGLTPTLLRDAPHAAVHLVIYNRLMHLTSDSTAISAGIAAVLATMFTHPIDVIKTRVQISSLESSISLKEHLVQMISAKDCFAGFLPRLFRKGLSSGLTWTLFSLFSSQLLQSS